MSHIKRALVIGGSRGYGHALVHALSSHSYQVYTTTRSATAVSDSPFPVGVKIITDVELTSASAGEKLVDGLLKLGNQEMDLVIYNAGFFKRDTIEKLSFTDQLTMYTVCAIAPTFIASALLKANLYAKDSIFLMITTEGGSIGLRTAEEGGGNYGHHGSKAAQNMVAKLLSIDLTKKGVTTLAIHPGFLRTEMTKSIGYDEYYDSGGAVHPDIAAESLIAFVETITKDMNGQLWAPRGGRDIGQARNVIGDDVAMHTPIQLPW